jgi:hypothetical protein
MRLLFTLSKSGSLVGALKLNKAEVTKEKFTGVMPDWTVPVFKDEEEEQRKRKEEEEREKKKRQQMLELTKDDNDDDMVLI